MLCGLIACPVSNNLAEIKQEPHIRLVGNDVITWVQMARKRSEAPRFIAGSLKDDVFMGSLPGLQPRGQRGEVLPAKGPARAPWPKLRLQVSSSLMSYLRQRPDLW